MVESLSQRMLQAAQRYEISPPENFERMVIDFGMGIGRPDILRDEKSSLHINPIREFTKPVVIGILGKILANAELMQLAIERTIAAHDYVMQLNEQSGTDSPKRLAAMHNLDPEHMGNVVRAGIKALYNNLTKNK